MNLVAAIEPPATISANQQKRIEELISDPERQMIIKEMADVVTYSPNPVWVVEVDGIRHFIEKPNPELQKLRIKLRKFELKKYVDLFPNTVSQLIKIEILEELVGKKKPGEVSAVVLFSAIQLKFIGKNFSTWEKEFEAFLKDYNLMAALNRVNNNVWIGDRTPEVYYFFRSSQVGSVRHNEFLNSF